jgi:hypothetical protein
VDHSKGDSLFPTSRLPLLNQSEVFDRNVFLSNRRAGAMDVEREVVVGP